MQCYFKQNNVPRHTPKPSATELPKPEFYGQCKDRDYLRISGETVNRLTSSSEIQQPKNL